MTRFLSLTASAWVGRIVTWVLLAWAWRRLSVAVVPMFLVSVLSAALFVAGTVRLRMADEWIIGGFEAKGLAYVFVLLACEAVARANWRAVWPLVGAASAFHVVVGAWTGLAAGIAWLAAGSARMPLRPMLRPLAIGILISLAGLVPALALGRGVDPNVLREANRIYVFERLPHHLVPQAFPAASIRRHLLLWLLWAVLCWVGPRTAPERRLRWMVGATIGFALAGFALGTLASANVATAAGVLRYYWFRLVDVFVPLGVAILAVDYIVALHPKRPAWATFWLLVCMIAAGSHLGEIVDRRWHNLRPPADDKIVDLAAWRDICQWVAENTEPDALFIVPRTAQTFRWYAGRAEVVCRKDIPQDAAGIVRWWRRMNDIYRDRRVEYKPGWYRSLADEGAARLEDVGDKYGADYVLTDAQPELPLELVSPPNPAYAVYRLPRRR
jgi:hypothetical protein